MKIPVSELLEECFDDQIHFQKEDEVLDQNWKERILEQIRQQVELQRKHRQDWQRLQWSVLPSRQASL